MSDLIDRNSLLRSLEKFAPEKHDALVEMLIKKEPTVEAVPVIRCKDCRYYKVYEVFGHTLPLCNRIKTMMADALEEDDYCSRAERKEE